MRLHVCMQYCQTEWETLENDELSNLRDAYKHQLEEQIALARQDIVNALQEQFQVDVDRMKLGRLRMRYKRNEN